MVNTVLAIFLILAMLGTCIGWFGTTGGLFVGLLSGALAAAVCGALVLLANIREVLEESRAIGADSARQGRPLVDVKEVSEKQQADESAWIITTATVTKEKRP